MSSIVVVGSSGVLGRAAIPLLQAAGHSVKALVRSESAAATLVDTTSVVGDVWDRDFLRQQFVGADVVIMLATAIPDSAKSGRAKAWKENSRIRAVLAPEVARVARELAVGRLIQESVMYVYADAGSVLVNEESLVEPTAQSETCLAAEHAARRFAADRDDAATAVVLRFAGFVSAESEHVQSALTTARSRGRALVLGDLGGFMTFVDVADAATAVAHAVGLPGGIYNVGGNPSTKQEFLTVLTETVDRPVKPLPAPVRGLLVAAIPMSRALHRSLRIDSTKLREHGWRPEFPDTQQMWQRAL